MDWNDFFKPTIWKILITLLLPFYASIAYYVLIPLIIFYLIKAPLLLGGYETINVSYIAPLVLNYIISCAIIFLSKKYFPEKNQKLLVALIAFIIPMLWILVVMRFTLRLFAFLYWPIILLVVALAVYKILKNKSLVTKILAALIILQIVYYILFGVFFLTAGWDEGYLVCNSSDPAKIMVKASDVAAESYVGNQEHVGRIIITNLTGGEISNVTCSGSNGFATSVANCPSTVSPGTDFELNPLPGQTGTYVTNAIEIKYKDSIGVQRSATITCSGPLEIKGHEPTWLDEILS